MKKAFEHELPEGYGEAMVIDAKSMKFTIIFNILALVVTGAILAIAIAIIKPTGFYENYTLSRNITLIAVCLIFMFTELLHSSLF